MCAKEKEVCSLISRKSGILREYRHKYENFTFQANHGMLLRIFNIVEIIKIKVNLAKKALHIKHNI